MAKTLIAENLQTFAPLARRWVPAEKPVIFEIGARDCGETLGFKSLFPDSTIYTFECNPQTLPLCRERVRGLTNVTLVEKAVSDTDGTVSFFPIDTQKTSTVWPDGNPGASSLLKASGKYPLESYVQKETAVEATTLDTFMREKSISHIDMMWMDIQGAELQAFRGMKERIRDVGIIHVEVEFLEIYSGQALFPEIRSYLAENGLIFIGFTNAGTYAGDAVFVNRTCMNALQEIYFRLTGSLRLPLMRLFRRVQATLK